MAYSEIKNSERTETSDNGDTTKMDYKVLSRIYKIVRDLLKNNDLDIAVSCIESLGDYYRKLYKTYKSERNSKLFFRDYVF